MQFRYRLAKDKFKGKKVPPKDDHSEEHIAEDQRGNKSFVKKIEKVKSGKRKEVVDIKKYNDSYRNDYGPSYNQLEQINIIQAHENGYKGQGVKILILDTGFYTEHEAINENNILSVFLDFIMR